MLSQFYATAFAKSSQLRTEQTLLWSEWIITPDCVYWYNFDILPEVPSLLSSLYLVLVQCITNTDFSSFSNCLPVSRRPHITVRRSLSFLLWLYRANVLSSLVNIPSCTHSLCQDAFEGHKK